MDSAWESWLHSKLKFIHQWIPCNVVIHSHKFHLFFGWQFFDEKYRHHKVPLIVNRKYDWRLRKTCRWIKFGMCVLVFFCIPFKCQRKYSISRWIFGGKIFWPRKIFNINKLWVCVCVCWPKNQIFQRFNERYKMLELLYQWDRYTFKSRYSAAIKRMNKKSFPV